MLIRVLPGCRARARRVTAKTKTVASALALALAWGMTAVTGMTAMSAVHPVCQEQPAAEPPPVDAPDAPDPAVAGGKTEAPPSLVDARQAWIEGRYADARQAFEAILAGTDDAVVRVRAGVGLARCLESVGREPEAVERLTALEGDGKPVAQWHVALARPLRTIGRYAEALDHARTALRLDPNDAEAHLIVAQILEYLGRREDAIQAYRWFDRQLVGRSDLRRDAVWLTDTARGFYRYSVLTQTDLVRRTKHVLVQMLQMAYERVDRSYWPARVFAADLLRSKYNNDESDGSVADYRAALRVNPNLPAAHVGLGEVALEGWKFEEVERRVKLAFETNPRFLPAHHLLARCRLQERRYADALKICQDALAINPNDLDAIALAAAAGACRYDTAAEQAMIARAEAINPRCALLYRTLGDALSGIRQYAESETYYRKAIALEPSDPNPRTELGMMYMQWGDEAAARKALDAAWSLDPFNQRTFNTLELLDSLENYDRFETEHFTVQYDEATDPGLGPYLGPYLEQIYPEVCGDYDYEPTEKTVIEVFPSLRAFAVRITGKPWIFTVGACTGRVIALASPRSDPKLQGPYDIASVLRHEFTHTITLGATRNRIPHWMTEGLAVWQEGSPRRFEWCELLADAIRRDRLFTLESINWGFIRPRRANDRQMAYAQSEWMCEYLIERYGYDIINQMLSRYRQGQTQQAVFETLLKTTPEAFDKAFNRWAVEQARGWGLDLTPLEDADTLRVSLVRAPDDAAMMGRLAQVELADGQYEKALELGRKAIDTDPKNRDGLEVTGRVLAMMASQLPPSARRRKQEDEAAGYLSRLLELDADNRVAHKFLGRIALGRTDFETAIKQFKALQRVCPLDGESYAGLGGIYLKRGQDDLALPQLLQLAPGRQYDAGIPARIARIYRRRKQFGQAVYYFRRAVFVSPFSVPLHEELADLLMLKGDADQALREYRLLMRLKPTDATYPARAAVAAHKLGREEQAHSLARQAVQLDPQSPAKSLLP